MSHFACLHCHKGRAEADHRFCLVELFKTNSIQGLKDWEKQGEYHGFELLRASPTFKAAACIQSVWRMFVARRKYRMRNVTIRKGRIRARIPREIT